MASTAVANLDCSEVVTSAGTTGRKLSELGFRIRGDDQPRSCSQTSAMVSLQSAPFRHRCPHRRSILQFPANTRSELVVVVGVGQSDYRQPLGLQQRWKSPDEHAVLLLRAFA